MNISNKRKATNADSVHFLAKIMIKWMMMIIIIIIFLRKMDDETAVHYSVLYAFNGSEAGPLIWWQMR